MSDEEAALFWGRDGTLSLSAFFSRFEEYLDVHLRGEERELLRYAIDADASEVSFEAFVDFLRGFGPLSACLNNVKIVLGSEWFYGHMSHDDAARFLDGRPVGTYLVRFSASQRGSFALEAAILDSEGQPFTLPIKINAVDDGFSIHESESGDKVFPTLHDLIAHYTAYLLYPLSSTLPFESWFHGDLSSADAGDLLAGKGEGIFLVRFSSRPGCYATSFVENGVVCHALILPCEGGFAVEGDKEVYPTVADVVAGFKVGLKRPLVLETNRRKQFVFETAKQELRRLRDAEDREEALFMTEAEIPEQPSQPVASSDSHQVVYMADGVSVKAGTFAGLVDQLLLNSTSKFAKAFLITYQSFCSEHLLLGELEKRYKRSEEKKIRLRICNVFKSWIARTFPAVDASLMQPARSFISAVAARDGKNLAGQLARTLQRCAGSGGSEQAGFLFSSPPPPLELPRKFESLADLGPKELARQVTLFEHELFAAVKPRELLGLAWTKKDKQARSPNLLRLIDNFNVISGWVVANILGESDVKRRGKVFEDAMVFAVKLFELNNFNSVMCVVAALESSAIHRLKKAKERISPKIEAKYDEVRGEVARASNFKALRARLEKVQPPFIPYVGMYQSDLTFIEEGNKDNVGEGLINFQKRRLVAGVIEKVEEAQSVAYNLEKEQRIQSMLKTEMRAAQLTDDEAYARSLKLEPRKK